MLHGLPILEDLSRLISSTISKKTKNLIPYLSVYKAFASTALRSLLAQSAVKPLPRKSASCGGKLSGSRLRSDTGSYSQRLLVCVSTLVLLSIAHGIKLTKHRPCPTHLNFNSIRHQCNGGVNLELDVFLSPDMCEGLSRPTPLGYSASNTALRGW